MNAIIRHFAVPSPQGRLPAHLTRPEGSRALIVVIHAGTCPAAATLTADFSAHPWAILEVDLLTAEETHAHGDEEKAAQLSQRLISVLDFIHNDGDTAGLPVGFYALGRATPAAIRAAAQRDATVRVIVVRGGLIDHAGKEYLEALAAPLLVLADLGDSTAEIIVRGAFQHLNAPHALERLETGDAGLKPASWFAQWLPE